MELGLGNTILAGDPRLVDHIVGEVKSQGIFDQFRKDCIADVDTKPAYQNLRTRVESSVNSFLAKQTWKADLNKNQLRETLRRHIHDAPYLDAGVERIVDQVVNPKVYSVFMPQIEDVVYKFLGLERPKSHRGNGSCDFKDLLPIDLDPVSPESDKNSLKDVSLDSIDATIDADDAKPRESSISNTDENLKGKENDKISPRNGNHDDVEANHEESVAKPPMNSSSSANLNNSSRSEDKPEEEEEDSPMFEPIDIMNLNESHASNDSHLSGISELTSHRSRSPDFSENSRDNMDFSNNDSEFSKVSSDSRLSIVTDFGSSNNDSAQFAEIQRDDGDKVEAKFAKDNFKAVREFEASRAGSKDSRSNSESAATKETSASDSKSIRRSLSSKETSRDGTEGSTKEKENSRAKIVKDTKKNREIAKKNPEKPSKCREKTEISKHSEKMRDSSRPREEKPKDPEKKEASKEVKDLKDIYKEKIRELREKKKDWEKTDKNRETKSIKDTKDKRDSSHDKKDAKNAKIGPTKIASREKTSKNADKDSKSSKNDRDKSSKRDEKKSKDHKSSKPDEKNDSRRLSRSEKDERNETKQKNSLTRKESTVKNPEGKRESESKEKKRREEKKPKSKDDHSSMRKNSDDRRSTDRDGSNGSNGKNSHKSGSSSCSSSSKQVTANLSKESTNTSNSSSETSDSIEESQSDGPGISADSKIHLKSREAENSCDAQAKRLDLGANEINLPIKKRSSSAEEIEDEILIKKPKFAKNFQEAKRLMKIRRKMEKEKIRRQQKLETEKNLETRSNSPADTATKIAKVDIQSVPDDERVQIIEVQDEEYDEPYPEIQSDFTLEERSQIILGAQSIFTSDLPTRELNARSTLSAMESSIRQSLKEMITDTKIEDTCRQKNSQESNLEAVVGEAEKIEFQDEASTSGISGNEKKSSTSGISGNEMKASGNEDETKASTSKDSESGIENRPNSDSPQRLDKIPDQEKNTVKDKENGEKSLPVIEPEISGKMEIGENTDSSCQNRDGNCHEAATPTEKLSAGIVESETIKIVDFETKSALDNAKKGEKIEAVHSEEKSELRAVEDEWPLDESESDEDSRLKIVEIEENSEASRVEAETRSELREKLETTGAPILENDSAREIKKREEDLKTEEKSRPEIVGNAEKSEATSSEVESKPEVEFEFEKSESSNTQEKLIETSVKNKSEHSEILEEKLESEIGSEMKKIKVAISDDKSAPGDEKNVGASTSAEKTTKISGEEDGSEIRKKSQNSSRIFKDGSSKSNEKSVGSLADEEEITGSSQSEETERVSKIGISLEPETAEKSEFSNSEKSSKIEDDMICESDDEPCLYFAENNERLNRFKEFVKNVEIDGTTTSIAFPEERKDEEEETATSSEEIVSAVSKTMAPPKPKRKYSTSPLTDILLNNANNNNNAVKKTETISSVDESNSSVVKKRKIGRPRKQKSNPSLCSQQNLLNGENFVMPLSPESDVSATSEKTPSNPIKDDKSRPRGSNQRYTSDDLYKPRPLFASSSRRSRRSNQA